MAEGAVREQERGHACAHERADEKPDDDGQAVAVLDVLGLRLADGAIGLLGALGSRVLLGTLDEGGSRFAGGVRRRGRRPLLRIYIGHNSS